MREVAAEREKPALLFSGGKDSIVLVRLAQKAFAPGQVPFPLLHIDTGHNFPEVIEFRDRLVAENGLDLLVGSVQASIDAGRVREETGPRASRNRLQTVTLLDAIEEHELDACFGGARRDEERARAKERVLSFRDDFGTWDPRRQRPELWDLYNARVRRGENIRAFPISNWTELDVWQYIASEELELPSIYMAHEREVFARDGMLYAVSPFIDADGGRGAVHRVRALSHGRRHELHGRGALRRRDAPGRRRRDRRDATSPSAARPAPTIARARPRWRTARRRATSSHGPLAARHRRVSVDDGKSTLIGRLLYDAKAVLADQLAHVEERSRRRARPRAAHRRPARRARAGHHDRRRLPLVRHAAAALHPRRLPRARAVHAQHGHGRLDRRPRAAARRRPRGPDRAVAPPRHDRRPAADPARDRRRQQDGPRRLRRGALRRRRARGARAGRRGRPARGRVHPDQRAERRQRRRSLARTCRGTPVRRCWSASRRSRSSRRPSTARGCRCSSCCAARAARAGPPAGSPRAR